MKNLMPVIFVIPCFWIATYAFAGSVVCPNTFEAGQTAVAAEVNANFDVLVAGVNDNDTRITSLSADRDDLMVDLSVYRMDSASGTKTYTGIKYGKDYNTGEFTEQEIAVTETWSPAPSEEDYDTYHTQSTTRTSDGTSLGRTGWMSRQTPTGAIENIGFVALDEGGAATAEFVFDPPRLVRPGGVYNRALAWGGEMLVTGYDASDLIISRYLEIYTFHILGVETVTVPAGTYENCLKISRIRAGGQSDQVYWYAPNIGFIKEFHRSDNGNGHIFGMATVVTP